jgi:hypothetical protein
MVWGEFRPANHSTTQYGELEFRRARSRTWRELALVRTSNSEGYVVAHPSIPAPGLVRLVWLNPSGGPLGYSRTVSVS